MMDFSKRLDLLPHLGIGVSTEYGAATQANALHIAELVQHHPQYARFLEVGVTVETGLDSQAVSWVESGRPTTYHFLDINLDDPRDLSGHWVDKFQALKTTLDPAWICGDAGLWHFGPRDRGHMLLLPPILSRDSAKEMAEGIVKLRDLSGLEVLPENPPGHVFVGDLHLLDFFALVQDEADTGMLLDAAHLAIYQDVMGHSPLTGLDGFPMERIVEMHIAGATFVDAEGLQVIEDDHTTNVLPATWSIAQRVLSEAAGLKAIIFECERNPLDECLDGFRKIDHLAKGSAFGRESQS